MHQGRARARSHVQRQGRAYAAIVGVTVGMLIAGLAVPLAFGRTRDTTDNARITSAQLGATPVSGSTPEPSSSSEAGQGGAPGATAPTRRTSPATGPRPRTTTTSSTTGSTEGTAPGAHSRTRLSATDQGVTATTIKLGVVVADIRALKPLGFSQPHFEPQEQRQQFQVFIDQVNHNGGLSGRTIVPDYKTYNALDTSGANSAAAICIQLAQDDKVFAAMGVLSGGIDVCLTQQFGIPVISSYSALKEAYRKAHDLLVTPFASLERLASDWGDLAVRSGLLRGRKLSTVSTGVPEETQPEQSLVTALAAAGQATTYRAHLSSDAGTGQSQLPVEIQKMKAAGVDTVFLVTNFAAGISFVQTAQQQGFLPQYVVSDIGQYQAEGLVANMGRSFDGAYLFTQGHSLDPKDPEGTQDQRCRTSFNATTGNHYGSGNESGGTYLFCWMVNVFSGAGHLVGPHLTRSGLATAFQHLSIPLGHTLGGSFGPHKTDYADLFRTATYSGTCKCYQGSGGVQAGRY